MSLSIIVPTTGRPSLAATLAAIAKQTAPGDSVIVIADGPSDAARAMFSGYARLNGAAARQPVRWTYVEADHGGAWGHPLRNLALDRLVTTTHVATIDDDDVHVDGALDLMRAAAAETWLPVVFRARWGAGHPAAGVELWHRPEVAYGNVATPMVVWPAATRARWGHSYDGDFRFYCELEVEYGGLVWRPETVAEVRPVAIAEAA